MVYTEYLGYKKKFKLYGLDSKSAQEYKFTSADGKQISVAQHFERRYWSVVGSADFIQVTI